MPAHSAELARCLVTHRTVPGWQAYCDGNVEASIQLLRKHVKDAPDDGLGWELLGLALRDDAQPLHAADAFERASLLTVLQPVSRLCLAECYAVLKRHTLAKELYLLQADLAETAELLLMVASGLDGIDQPQLSLDMCRRAAGLDPELGQVPYDMCFYAMRCGCPASMAESLAWRAVELEPDNIHYRIGLATLLIRLGDRTRACWVLRMLAAEQFALVNCTCCLQRVLELYSAAGELEMVQRCKNRIEELDADEASRNSSDPKPTN